MKLGIMQGRLFPNSVMKLQQFPTNNWLDEIFAANNIGFNEFELLYDKKLDCLSVFRSEDSITRLKRAKQDTGISTSSICVDYFANFNNMSKREEFLKLLYDIASIAKSFSIETIVIPYCDENSINTVSELADVLNFFNLIDLDNFLESQNITIAMEMNIKGELISNTFSKYTFKNIGICYDIGNASGNGYVAHKEIVLLQNYIKHIHIKDKPLNGKNVMLGEGIADFKECINSLKRINYAKSCIFETGYFSSPIEEATQNYSYIKQFI